MNLKKLHYTLYIYTRTFLTLAVDRQRRYSAYRKLSRQSAPFIISIEADGVGLFAQLFWCIVIWNHYSEKGLPIPTIRCTSANYAGTNGDWLAHISDSKQSAPPPRASIKIRRFEHLPFFMEGSGITLKRATELVRTHLPISPRIQSQVQSFVEKHFGGKVVLGVHYRGTDKHLEAQRIPHLEFLEQIEKHVEAIGAQVVFVATDEEPFAKAVSSFFMNRTHVVMLEHSRSTNADPIHQRMGGGVEPQTLAEEALVDCLILSKCQRLLKTPSMLSGWAKIFNPDLEVCMIGELHANRIFFPDSQLSSKNLS